jgi:hypothetical protein
LSAIQQYRQSFGRIMAESMAAGGNSETIAIEAADLGGLNRDHSRCPADAD